jgi:RNA-directed DNA polymerase
MTGDLQTLTEMSRSNRKMRFTSLMGMLFRTDGLRDSFDRQPANRAVGVDGERKDAYGLRLEDRLATLSTQLRHGGYYPKPSRRVYIPKANGGVRPLGIPSFEDRIVQDRLSGILQAIWEPEFRDCSFGFRPGRSAHDALRRIAEVVTNEGTQWIVEADIKGFFNHVCHDHLLRFLGHRITDPRLLEVLRRFLKAGVLEDGVIAASEEGTPQGGLVSPVLANIYLHYVLDWWFEVTFTKTCRDTGRLIRYADDYVACFRDEQDARRFLAEMQNRLNLFGLEVEPSKTLLLRFGSRAWFESKRPGGHRPATFSFLGLTHYVGTSQTGGFVIGRTTDSKRARKKLKEFTQKLRSLRVNGGAAMLQYAQQHIRGHINYYGVSGNARALMKYVRLAGLALFKWLNRRSQRRSLEWGKWNQLLRNGLLPLPRVVHNLYPAPSR